MTLEQAKQVSDILQKIDKNNEIINNLEFKKTYIIQFGRGNNESSFNIIDKELIDSIIKHILHELSEEILKCEQEIKCFKF